MITISPYHTTYLSGFNVEGHADAKGADDEYDLVCSAVSAVTQTTGYGLLTMGATIEKQNDGVYRVHIPDYTYDAYLLMKTMLDGLMQLEKQYPENLNVEREKQLNEAKRI